MSHPAESPGGRILSLWRALSTKPGGTWVFMRILGRMVPYTGALGARVLALEPGGARVSLRERRGVRNHLRSIHAAALVNLGELATGLAVVTALPPDVRGIVTELSAVYHAKARGRVTAECRAPGPWTPGQTVEATARITDGGGLEVATVTARWALGETL